MESVRNILIDGIDSVLGSYFAARCLESSGDRVFYVAPQGGDAVSDDQPMDAAAHLAGLIAENKGMRNSQEMMDRLLPVGSDLKAEVPRADASMSEAWHFVAFDSGRNRTDRLDAAITSCARAGAKEFNVVAYDVAGPGGGKIAADGKGIRVTEHMAADEILQRCAANGLRCRIFLAPLVMGTAVGQAGSLLSRFLSTLHVFRSEIDERSSQYFDFKALRYCAPADAPVNLIPAHAACDLMIGIARTESTAGQVFSLAGPENTSLMDLFERIGIACNLSIVPAADPKELNAIDRIFLQRLNEAGTHISPGALPHSAETFALAGVAPDSARPGEEGQIEFFESVRRSQDKALSARRRRAADLPARLKRKAVVREQSELTYFTGGESGDVIVVLNALGQGVEYWRRLLDNLVEDHRVIIWDPRGTVSPSAFVLSDQVDDLDAVLRQEGVESCHVIGWCTGLKVAVEFHERRPSVIESMAMLNCTLKCDGGTEELDSDYERNLESLFRMVVRKPAMAASVRKTLQEPKEKSETEILEDPDVEQMSVNVLTLMNGDLQEYVLAPFKTEETTLNYANQMVDFWKHDLRPKVAGVRAPVLLLSAEYDQVATPDASVAAAGMFPRVRHVHVPGATHYCLYDRPEFVARMLREFFADPGKFVAPPSSHAQPSAPASLSPDAGAPPQAVAISS